MDKRRRPLTKEHKDKLSKSHKWVTFSEETKMKMSNSKKWKKFSDEHKVNLSKSHIWFKYSKERKEKMSELFRWNKSHFRKWWLSFESYTTDRTVTLRRSIRERDNYICKICWELQWDIAHDVHHIDYDKSNCNPNNLITLCHSCHMKTNTKREFRIEYFRFLLSD